MGLKNNPDQDWQTWGGTNPYFGVLSDPKYLNVNLNDEVVRDFFDSGESHIAHVYNVIRTKIRADFQPSRVLDYGCGVGRLIVPLAKRCQTVIGVDISTNMLQEARKNCLEHGISSASLLHVDEMSTLAPSSLDLVHSLIVLQHIPTNRGELVLRTLLPLVAEGGVGAIHLTYSNTRSTARRFVVALREHSGFLHKLLNLVQRRPFSTPHMQMNCYSMNRIFDMLLEQNCSKVYVELLEHDGYHGVMIYFEKPRRPSFDGGEEQTV